MRLVYIWNNWEVRFNHNELYIQSNFGNAGAGYKTIGREYDVPAEPDDVEFDGSYIKLSYVENGRTYQFKLEGDSCIVGDVWKDGEHIDSIAMWDLWDDWEEPVPTSEKIS